MTEKAAAAAVDSEEEEEAMAAVLEIDLLGSVLEGLESWRLMD